MQSAQCGQNQLYQFSDDVHAQKRRLLKLTNLIKGKNTRAAGVKILERKNTRASVFLRFPKVEQHPKCMDHAILLGKPFGNCFIE
jgi:hypothetical protein